MTVKPTCPLESQEQRDFMRLCRDAEPYIPALRLVFHVPNEGKRSAGAQLVAQGLKRGVPDVFCLVPVGRWHGWVGELKRQRGTKPSEDQEAWLSALREQGYHADWYKGGRAAWESLKAYLEGRL